MASPPLSLPKPSPLPNRNTLSERPTHGVSRGQGEDSVRASQSPYIGDEDALTENAGTLLPRTHLHSRYDRFTPLVTFVTESIYT